MKSPLPALGASVHPVARGRGEMLALGGRVRWTRTTARRVEATVGADAADVVVQRTPRSFVCACTCPDRSPACEHVWAVLVQAWSEGRELLRDMPPKTLLAMAGSEVADVRHAAANAVPDDAAQLGFGRLLQPKRRAPEKPPQHEVSRRGPAAAAPTRSAAPRGPAAPAFAVPAWVEGAPAAKAPAPPCYVFALAGSSGLSVRVLSEPPPRRGGLRFGTLFRLALHEMRLYDGTIDQPALDAILGRRARRKDDDGERRFMGETLQGDARREALSRALDTGRCYFAADGGTIALGRDDGPPYALVLRVTEVDAGVWHVEGLLRRGAEELSLSAPRALFSDGSMILSDHVARYDDAGGASWIELLRLHGRHTVTPKHRGAFLEELYGRARSPALELPAGRELAVVAIAPEPRLTVTPREGALTAKLAFVYGGAVVPAGRVGKTAFDADAERLVQRDADAENRALADAHEAGFTQAARAPEGELEILPARFGGAVEALMQRGFRVEAAGAIYKKSGAVRASVRSSGTDWFEVRGHVEFDGASVDLAAVLDAARRGEKVIPLGDGTLGVLPDAWLQKHGFVARLGERKGDAVRFGRAQLGLVDTLLEGDDASDVGFQAARAELSAVERAEAADPGPRFLGTLRPYQREGLGWLRYLERARLGGCLADEMGLGKTIQVLALLASRERRGPSLVVAPRSLLYNWRNEAARFAPSLRVMQHAGAARDASGFDLRTADIVLTTYGTLRRDAEALAAIPFDYVILDEAQAIKNEASDTAKAARRLRAHHRLVISGTPIENHIGELWSLFEFMNPGMLGSLAAFRDVVSRDAAEGTRTTLARGVRPFLLRRTKAAVAPDLPPRVDETILCELGDRQRAVYEDLRHRYRAALLGQVATQGIGRAKIHVLEALLRLRQAACHPALVDAGFGDVPSAKLSAFVDMLGPVLEGGHKAIVFSQFTRLLALVRERLDAAGVTYAYLDGGTVNREAEVARFQSDAACPVFLVSLKAGGVGLNLTAAEYVFLLDPWWNPAVEAQAMDRAHRIGQTRTVFTYKLVAKDTVEERILALQRDKQRLAESLFDESSSLLGDLTADDLESLLS